MVPIGVRLLLHICEFKPQVFDLEFTRHKIFRIDQDHGGGATTLLVNWLTNTQFKLPQRGHGEQGLQSGDFHRSKKTSRE